MTGKRHEYQVVVTWTGNLGEGTARYAAYSRDHDVSGEAKPTIPGTADPAFGGDLTRWNPEELFVASLSQCHMLEFLARAARAGVVVTRYLDEPSGTMLESGDGGSARREGHGALARETGARRKSKGDPSSVEHGRGVVSAQTSETDQRTTGGIPWPTTANTTTCSTLPPRPAGAGAGRGSSWAGSCCCPP